MSELITSCVFCREIKGSRHTNFARLYPELPSRYLVRLSSLVAFPCIGQLTPGHFLIAPRLHYSTFREAITLDPNVEIEFTNIFYQMHEIINANPESSLMFEHGAISHEDGGCGIYHAHVHVVPNAGHIDLREYINMKESLQCKSYLQTYENISDKQSYGIFGSKEHGFFHLQLNRPLPSQYFRKAVASGLGISNWNWQSAGRESEFLKLFRPLSLSM